ncbi:hypothetical protein HOH87_00875 [bacterium]|jgi:hypothetical protein|nr:hypothetical protein [bacterium]
MSALDQEKIDELMTVLSGNNGAVTIVSKETAPFQFGLDLSPDCIVLEKREPGCPKKKFVYDLTKNLLQLNDGLQDKDNHYDFWVEIKHISTLILEGHGVVRSNSGAS